MRRSLQTKYRPVTAGFGHFLTLVVTASYRFSSIIANEKLKAMQLQLHRQAGLSHFMAGLLSARDSDPSNLMPPFTRLGNMGMAFLTESGGQPISAFAANSPRAAMLRVAELFNPVEIPVGATLLKPHVENGNPKVWCSEFQILEHLSRHEKLENRVVELFSERVPCKSCRHVLSQFLTKNPRTCVSFYFEFADLRSGDSKRFYCLSQTHNKQLKITSLAPRLTSRRPT